MTPRRGGLPWSPRAPIFRGNMTLFKYFSPLRAFRDLRLFLATRKRHELWFMALAAAITVLILSGFVADSRIEREYRPNIIYVESWPLTRTDEQIRAQQKIDQAKKRIAEAEIEKKRKAQQAEFKKIDDKLESWGL